MRQNRRARYWSLPEVGLAVILLIGSALLIPTFLALYAVDRGFDTSNVVTMRMSLTGPRFLKSAGVAPARHSGHAADESVHLLYLLGRCRRHVAKNKGHGTGYEFSAPISMTSRVAQVVRCGNHCQ